MSHNSFVFDLNFDVPEVVVPTIEESQMPMIYTQDDMDAALVAAIEKGRSIGYEEGFVQGELKAITERQLQIQAAFVKIYEDIELLLVKEEAYESKMHANVMSLSRVILEKIFPSFYATNSGEEMVKAIQNIIETLVAPQPLLIHLSPAALEDIEEKIKGIQERYQEKVVLKANPDLKTWECIVEWKSGGARWSQENLISKIQELLENDPKRSTVDLDAAILGS